jgi:hypothetical protein
LWDRGKSKKVELMSIEMQKFSLRSSSQLFFTTIAMILLLVVGLSTATFAWFSANSRVGSGSIIFEARNTASASIYLGWVPDSVESSITFSAPEEIDPMVPSFAPINTTRVDDFTNNFYTASISPEGDNGEPSVFNENGFRVLPYKAYQGPPDSVETQDYFYVINGSAEPTIVVMQVTFEGDNAALLRVGLFVNETYVGTIRPYDVDPMATTHCGPIVEGGNPYSDGFIEIPTDMALSFGLGGKVDGSTDHFVRVEVVCWYDGVWLDEDFMDGNAEIALVFRGQKGFNNPNVVTNP